MSQELEIDLNAVEINPDFQRALYLMENTSRHVFVTGKAGTGKSTLLQYFKHTTSKSVVFLAPTGVAAINIGGETIHSFFMFRPDITPDRVKRVPERKREIYNIIETIVIDEISMVRADLLDCVDVFLRKNREIDLPFGGVQMIFIGDLYQLPPVVKGEEKKIFKEIYKSAFFFDAKVMNEIMFEFVELQKVYRQSDEDFIDLLNAIRNGTVGDEHIEKLNSRVGAEIDGQGIVVYLTTTNEKARRINRENLEKLRGKLYEFPAYIDGEFDRGSYPADPVLHIKKGAQIMMLNNDRDRYWVNGTMGIVRGVRYSRRLEAHKIIVELDNGYEVEVLPYTWEIFKYRFDRDMGKITTETIGSFTQYPMKLAWAVTIHKSQGKTFDNVIIDIGRGAFSAGQVYVALSRCTSFDGISLVKPIKKKNIFVDYRCVKFLTSYQYMLSEKRMPMEEKIRFIEKAIKQGKNLEIEYLKPGDERSVRVVTPEKVVKERYRGVEFMALKGYCHLRKQNRTFRIDRILRMRVVE